MADNRTPWRLKGDWVEACNCNHGCNCQFAGVPNEGKCEGVFGCAVKDGTFGGTSLNGLRFAIAFKYPKAIHEGNGHVVLFVDDKAPQGQVDAIATILSGKMGGMPWEALGGTIARFDGPIRKPVEIQAAAERSVIRVPGALETVMTPLKNPVTGEDKEVHIVYPKGGFFWNDGAIATTQTMHAEHGDFRIEWPGRFASASQVSWGNGL
jgi:hypothetical protein